MENFDLTPEIRELLETAVHGTIDNYSITLHEGNKKGDGYLGDFLILTLKHLKTKKEVQVVIKQANSSGQLVNESFKTEIYFYKTIVSKFVEFQKDFAHGLEELDIFPKCLQTNLETTTKRIILENLRYKNFEITDRTKSLDKNHMELLVQCYAKFHALSFAMKHKNPPAYSKLLQPFIEQTEAFDKLYFLSRPIHKTLKKILENNGDFKPQLMEKLNEYVTNTEKIFFESCKYVGDYSVVIHGDSWSNNMMFKYSEDRKPVDIRLIDFQLSRIGSPVHDLSYGIYAGASKEILDNLEDYLKEYHDTLRMVLKEFGCEADVIYPFSVLKDEWKRYSMSGYMMALIVWCAKLLISGAPSIDDVEKGTAGGSAKFDDESHKKISRLLTLHMYENNYL